MSTQIQRERPTEDTVVIAERDQAISLVRVDREAEIQENRVEDSMAGDGRPASEPRSRQLIDHQTARQGAIGYPVETQGAIERCDEKGFFVVSLRPKQRMGGSWMGVMLAVRMDVRRT